MYFTVTIRGVKVLAKRDTGVLCERAGRTFEIPLEALWDEGDELVVGSTCEIEVRESWAVTNGHDHD
jgi:hypothetical protein